MGEKENLQMTPPPELTPGQWPLLWQASRQIMQHLPADHPTAALAAVAEAFSTLLEAEQSRVYLPLDRKPGRLNFKASHPETSQPDHPDILVEPLIGLNGTAIRDGWLCHFTPDDARGALAKSLRLVTGACRNAFVVALNDDEGKIQGLVVLENKKTPPAGFGETDTRLAAALAGPARAGLSMFRARQRSAAHQAAMQERLEQVMSAFGLANAELSRAARVSDQFLANMSHELRTPLNTILGMSQALQEGVMGPVNDDQMSYLLMVEKAGRHLLTMLTDILTLSKAGAGRLDMMTGPVAAQALCQECMQFVIQPARQKHMKVEMKCDPRAAVFEADENILKQILVNLLTNAVKFTGERGAIGLEVKVEPERQTIEFCVWDNGVGIAPENLGRLFQPFVQLNDGLARLYPGTGLGLSLIYKLTELHSGSVAVESEPDKGSRFMVRLPWQEEPLESLASGTGAGVANDEAPRILLVDDNELSIERMQRSLESGGYRVTVARQGAEALERAAEEKPTVMVVDLQLSGMNGWAVIKHVRANPKMADVPIVGTTAMVIPGDRERCLQAGADEYLIKPICRTDLLAVVAGLIKKTAEPAANGGPPAQ